VDLEPLAAPVIPELPSGEWSERARLTWEAWRSDPVTAQWSPADVAYALDAIVLYEGMTSRDANEVRLRMDGLGLTPKGKRDLRWRVSAQAAAVPRKSRSGSSSRRARLSIVET
jgi:hypothetical protein